MNENVRAEVRARWLPRTCLYAGLFVSAWITWGWILELGILGWDSYPLIAAGRVQSAAEFFGTLGEELMDGRYPLGRYWRPLVHWSIALDFGLHGLDPRGYHWSDLILLASCACALTCLGRRLSLGGGWLAGGVAGLIWILHPIQLEVLSVPARRAESLATLFTCCALAALLRPGALRLGRSLWIGLLCCAALASKESGIIALVLVLASGLLRTPARLLNLRALLPCLGLVSGALAWRCWLLSGIGGSPYSSLGQGLTSSSPYLSALLFPSADLGVPAAKPPESWLLVGLPLALGLLLWLLRRPQPSGSHAVHPAPLLILWLAGLASVSAMAGIQQTWYALPFLAPLALWLGCLAEAAWIGLRRPSRRRHLAPIGALCLCLMLVLQFASISLGSSQRRLLLLQASASSQGLLDEFRLGLDAAQPSSPIEIEAHMEWTNPVSPPELPSVRVHTLAPYSLEALADLWGTPGRVLVSAPGLPSQRPLGPDAIQVFLVAPGTRE